MALCKAYKPCTRLGYEELDGLLTVLDRRICETVNDLDSNACYYYTGAALAVHIFRYHEFVDVPDDFIRLFDLQIKNMKLNMEEEHEL